MRDMNDYYVNSDCQTKIHIGNYLFTIAELFNIACDALSQEELEKYRETYE